MDCNCGNGGGSSAVNQRAECPCKGCVCGKSAPETAGIAARDWFAGLVFLKGKGFIGISDRGTTEAAEYAYRHADLFLAVRDGGKSGGAP